MFTFPDKDKKTALHKKWKRVISTFRRSGGSDNFQITANTYVCEFHFKITDIKVSAAGTHKKTLKADSVPSVFKFKQKTDQQKRKSPRKRISTDANESDELVCFPDIHSTSSSSDFEICEDCVCENLAVQLDYYRKKSISLALQVDKLRETNLQLEKEVSCLKKRVFSYHNFIEDEEMFRHVTGLESEKFNILYEYLDPGENCENIKYHDPSKTYTDRDEDVISSPGFNVANFETRSSTKFEFCGTAFPFFNLVKTWLYFNTYCMVI